MTTSTGLLDLNEHLFRQLERLSRPELTPEQIEDEVKRSGAIIDVADRITDVAKTRITAAKLFAEHGRGILDMLPTVGHEGARQIDGPKQGSQK